MVITIQYCLFLPTVGRLYFSHLVVTIFFLFMNIVLTKTKQKGTPQQLKEAASLSASNKI